MAGVWHRLGRILLLSASASLFRTQPRSESAGHGLESCCCSSVSHGLLHGPPALRYWFRTQPRSEGADLKNCFYRVQRFRTQPRSERPATSTVFMGSKGDGKHFVGLHLAWPCCCSSVSHILLGMGSNPAAVRVFRMGSSTAPLRCAIGFGPSLGARVPTSRTVFIGSKGDGKHFVGLHFAWHGLESCLAWARLLLLFECFAWAPPRHSCVALLVSDPASQRGCRPQELFLDSKGDGKHFVALHFAWHGLESCCCSSVSHGLLHGTPALRYWFRIQPRSESAGHKNCFYGFQR